LNIPPTIRTERKYQGKRLNLRNDYVDCGLESLVCREVVEHPGAVVILPVLDDGNLLMIEQYRHPIETFMFEFPAGTLEKDESPDICAARELVEETNMRASRLESLGILHPAPGFCNEVQYLFIAHDLTHEQGTTDPGEVIETRSLHISEIKKAIVEGMITDSKSIAILYHACLRGLVG
jgi:ADP-ribose pyrophosphatase